MRSFPVDLGASHIEGASSMNSMYNLACQEGLLKSSLVASNPYKGTFMTSSGAVLPPAVESAVHYSFEAIEDEAKTFFRNKIESEETLWRFFERRIEEESAVFPELYRGLANRALYGRLNELRSYWGDDLDKIPLDQYGAFKRMAGCNVRVPSGMIGTIGSLIRDMPDYSVKYCKPVKLVKWKKDRNEESKDSKGKEKAKGKKAKKDKKKKGKDKKDGKKDKEEEDDSRPATVVCVDGTTFPADYVIVTCSLGYLKKHNHTFFVPCLPEEKQDAIEKLGWGHLCHIYLLYNEPFWVWKEGLVRLAWSCEELVNKGSWLKGVGTVTEVQSSVQMLMVKVAGPQAKEAEDLSQERLAEDVTKLLRCFIGDPTLPYPFLVLQSKWSSNDYVLGGKSYITTGSKFSDICALADPVPGCSADVPVILFAGEATSHHYFGTMHGARLSGIREADRIIKLTHRFQGRPYEFYSPACSGYLVPDCCAAKCCN